jgi:hypothetical protein
MSENVKINEKCIKGNTSYYKIKIADMVKYEIEKLGVDEEAYQKLNFAISNNLLEFTDKMVLGRDFNLAMTNLRDETISECAEIDKNAPSKMRPFFKDYIFDKIYTMGINIKNGTLPDDFEEELEAAKLAMDEENKQREEYEKQQEEEEKLKLEEKNTNEIALTIEDETEEKPADLVDQMWDYFFNNSKSSSSKVEKKTKKNDKDKVKGE